MNSSKKHENNENDCCTDIPSMFLRTPNDKTAARNMNDTYYNSGSKINVSPFFNKK